METIVLSGPPGAGKSSVGARLAAALNATFVDTDALIESRTGKSVPAFLREQGEVAFRLREAEVVRELFTTPTTRARVVAFGGGTVLDRDLRFLALDCARVVTLSAREDTLRSRLAGGPERPLAGAGAIGLARLLDQRRAAYAECHTVIATDDLSLDQIVAIIVPWQKRTLVAVPLGERSYCVEIVRHDPTRVIDHLAALAPSSVVSVTDAHVKRDQGKLLDSMLSALAVPRVEVVLESGEAHKTLSSVATIWDAALGAHVDRDAVVFAFGGGVTLDLGGFAAATLLRGVRWVGAPTTVLAMLDASVGGKTGFDHPSGKNLVGAFHQPRAVIAELSSLATLPVRERRAGMAEALKVALTSDSELFALIESKAEALRDGDGDESVLVDVLAMAIAAKAKVVRSDELERGERIVLNFGHTVGHALEAHGTYSRWLHGEAVAIGLVAELRAGHALGFTPTGLAERTTSVLERLGLTTQVDRPELAAALPWMASDKKRRGGRLRLPIVTAVGQTTCEDVVFERFAAALGCR